MNNSAAGQYSCSNSTAFLWEQHFERMTKGANGERRVGNFGNNAQHELYQPPLQVTMPEGFTGGYSSSWFPQIQSEAVSEPGKVCVARGYGSPTTLSTFYGIQPTATGHQLEESTLSTGITLSGTTHQSTPTGFLHLPLFY